MSKLDIFKKMSSLEHEQVVYCYNKPTGLKAIIGIHNRVLGPALGGLRMFQYKNEAEALKDVLRLSRGMTFKNSLAGIDSGGGKAIIIGNPKKHKTEALLRAFGEFVENLNGKYITAEDVGMTPADIETISKSTKYISGMPKSRGGLGDPSPFTAQTTYMGMKSAAKKAYGNDSLKGKKISVQGVGHVAVHLIGFLMKEDAKVFVSDPDKEKIKDIISKYSKVKAVGLDEIYDLDVDIYAPCALGATINDGTLERLKCHIIAGCANNQLEDETIHGKACLDKGIIYAPDFLINSGGVINTYAEIKGLTTNWTKNYIATDIYSKILEILNISTSKNRSTQDVAMELAKKRIEDMTKLHN